MSSVPTSTSGGIAAPRIRFAPPLLDKGIEIEAWFRSQWQRTPPPFYCSVDLRNAGFKLAPVDTNLFPGGFNNLNTDFEAICIQALQSAMERSCASARSLLLIPENHTRNRFYLENVATLRDLIVKAGYELRIGSLLPDLDGPVDLDLELSGRRLRLEPLLRRGRRLELADGFSPCAVLLNNDLSGGVPPLLDDLEQTLLPPTALGWHRRLKSQHFGFYREVAKDFAALTGIDPWLVDPLFRNCGQINFLRREGEDCLVSNVELLLADLRQKYAEHGIADEPFAIIKSDAGTYGMGVMTVRSADDVRALNRRARTHMASAKEGREVTGAIIQEGVPTLESWGEQHFAAEPVVYMIDRCVVGGFYRVNENRGRTENLNAPGMSFKPLPFRLSCGYPQVSGADPELNQRHYLYGIVARLALLAAARESAALRDLSPHGQEAA